MILLLGPINTGFGVAVFVTARSAWPLVATTTVAVAELLDGFGSGVADAILAVSVITVPEAVVPLTLTVTVKVVDAPTANVGIVQEIEVVGVGQLHPVVPDVTTTETNEVLPGSGRASVNASPLAAVGPLLVTTTV